MLNLNPRETFEERMLKLKVPKDKWNEIKKGYQKSGEIKKDKVIKEGK